MYTSITISIKQKKFSNMEENKRDLVFMADYTLGWIVNFQPKLQTSAIHPLSRPLNFRFKKHWIIIHHLHVQIVHVKYTYIWKWTQKNDPDFKN